MSFFEGPSADLGPKVWFWNDLRFSRGPTIHPWSVIFDQTGSKKLPSRRTEASLELTWARCRAENAPRIHVHWFWIDFDGKTKIEITRFPKNAKKLMLVPSVRSKNLPTDRSRRADFDCDVSFFWILDFRRFSNVFRPQGSVECRRSPLNYSDTGILWAPILRPQHPSLAV